MPRHVILGRGNTLKQLRVADELVNDGWDEGGRHERVQVDPRPHMPPSSKASRQGVFSSESLRHGRPMAR